ncbi:MAG: hypothetical protein IJU45_01925 [Clostridia bacterium]|nr:hypothetical protein [Clostridia bacterium]
MNLTDFFGGILVTLGALAALPSTILITALMVPAAMVSSVIMDGNFDFVKEVISDTFTTIAGVIEILLTPSLW